MSEPDAPQFQFLHDEVSMASFDGHPIIDIIRGASGTDDGEALFNNGIGLLMAVWGGGGTTGNIPLSALMGAAIALWAVANGMEGVTPETLAQSAASLVAVADRMAATTLLARLDDEGTKDV